MDFSFSKITTHLKELIITPKTFWEKQEGNKESKSLFITYYLPFVAIVALAVFLGEFFKRTDFFIEYPLLKSLREVALFVLQYFIAVYFTKELMKTFGGEKEAGIAKILVVYSMVPFLLISLVTGFFEYFSILKVLGFYSFYLFWIGAEILVKLPENRMQQYLLIVIFVNLLSFSFLGWILTTLFEFILLKI